jgi:hypothetical protein
MITSLEQNMDDANEDDSEVELVVDLMLGSIWDGEKLSKYLHGGKKRWKCLWCKWTLEDGTQ